MLRTVSPDAYDRVGNDQTVGDEGQLRHLTSAVDARSGQDDVRKGCTVAVRHFLRLVRLEYWIWIVFK